MDVPKAFAVCNSPCSAAECLKRAVGSGKKQQEAVADIYIGFKGAGIDFLRFGHDALVEEQGKTLLRCLHQKVYMLQVTKSCRPHMREYEAQYHVQNVFHQGDRGCQGMRRQEMQQQSEVGASSPTRLHFGGIDNVACDLPISRPTRKSHPAMRNVLIEESLKLSGIGRLTWAYSAWANSRHRSSVEYQAAATRWQTLQTT